MNSGFTAITEGWLWQLFDYKITEKEH